MTAEPAKRRYEFNEYEKKRNKVHNVASMGAMSVQLEKRNDVGGGSRFAVCCA